MKMIGMSIRSTATRFCSSRPLRSGSVTSSTKQLGAKTRGQDRNSCADANVSGRQPAEPISNSSDLRTETSSSTTNTIGVACDIGHDLDPALRSSGAGAFLRHCRFGRYHIFLLDTAAYRSGRIQVMRNSEAWMSPLVRAAGNSWEPGWPLPPRVVALHMDSRLRAIDSEQGRP